MTHHHHGHAMAADEPEEFRRQREDAEHMATLERVELETSLDRLVDSLSAEQTYALSRMIRVVMSNPFYGHMLLGELAMLMRRIHEICAQCGDPGHSTVDHVTAYAPAEYPVAASEIVIPNYADPDVMEDPLVIDKLGDLAHFITSVTRKCRKSVAHSRHLYHSRIQGSRYCPGLSEEEAGHLDEDASELEA